MMAFIRFLDFKPMMVKIDSSENNKVNHEYFHSKKLVFDFIRSKFNILQNEKLNDEKKFTIKINNIHFDDEFIQKNDTSKLFNKINFIEVQGKLFGGKGGFGSLLKKQKATKKIKKNIDSCKTLDGRRLRDVNIEKTRKNLIIKKQEEENILNKYLNPSENKVLKVNSRNNLENNKKIDEDLEFERSIMKSINYLKNKRCKIEMDMGNKKEIKSNENIVHKEEDNKPLILKLNEDTINTKSYKKNESNKYKEENVDINDIECKLFELS